MNLMKAARLQRLTAMKVSTFYSKIFSYSVSNNIYLTFDFFIDLITQLNKHKGANSKMTKDDPIRNIQFTSKLQMNKVRDFFFSTFFFFQHFTEYNYIKRDQMENGVIWVK